MTHPFHPLFGQEFELLAYRHNWGEHRVYFLDGSGEPRSLPAQFTSASPEDPFVALAAGRSPFRPQDLRELADLLEGIGR